jgi:hypothetical protein
MENSSIGLPGPERGKSLHPDKISVKSRDTKNWFVDKKFKPSLEVEKGSIPDPNSLNPNTKPNSDPDLGILANPDSDPGFGMIKIKKKKLQLEK